MPKEPQFERYLKSKGIDPEHFYSTRSNPLAKKLIRESSKIDNKDKQVDIIRLSHNVKSNMRQPDNYKHQEDISSDIKLKNRDVELNFGKREVTPLKDFMPESSPHKLDTEEDTLDEEDKLDIAKEEFASDSFQSKINFFNVL
jgi:hypothetical protein